MVECETIQINVEIVGDLFCLSFFLGMILAICFRIPEED
jgi:hypothetical protein